MFVPSTSGFLPNSAPPGLVVTATPAEPPGPIPFQMRLDSLVEEHEREVRLLRREVRELREGQASVLPPSEAASEWLRSRLADERDAFVESMRKSLRDLILPAMEFEHTKILAEVQVRFFGQQAGTADAKPDSTPALHRQAKDPPKRQGSGQISPFTEDGPTEKRSARAVPLIRSPLFWEVTVCLTILLNTILLAGEMQYRGFEQGYALNITNYRPAEETWPVFKGLLWYFEFGFASLFSLEAAIRFVFLRSKWFRSCFNYVDVLVVGISWVALFLRALFDANPGALRMVRFIKLFRVLRLFGSGRVFDSLRLLLSSIKHSVSTLGWSLLIICALQLSAAIFLQILVEGSLNDPSLSMRSRIDLFEYYGTFGRSFATMFEVAFANYAPAQRVLMNQVDEAWCVFFIIYKCVLCYAILNVVQAVFIQCTLAEAKKEVDFVLTEKQREKDALMANLGFVFAQADTSGDGSITQEEFDDMMKNEELVTTLLLVDINLTDAHGIFKYLDDDDSGEISSQEFVKALKRLRGGATAMDMQYVMGGVHRLEHKVDTMFSQLQLKVVF